MSKVSVIIPSFNHKQFVGKTIDSVYEQNYPNLELIIIDDGSTDGTPELLKNLAQKLNFKLILKNNEGVCATLNRGLKEASGDFITFIASDDYMSPNRLAEQVDFLIAHPEVEVVAGAVNMIDINNNVLTTKQPSILGLLKFDDILKRNIVAAPTAMFRKNVFQKYGFYREDYAFEDYYMWLKILKAGGKIYNTNKIWAFYRTNESQFEKRFVWYLKGFVQALSDYLPDIRAKKMIQKYRLIFSAKMALLIGPNLFKTYPQEVKSIPVIYQWIFRFIALIPETIRQKLLFFLLKHY